MKDHPELVNDIVRNFPKCTIYKYIDKMTHIKNKKQKQNQKRHHICPAGILISWASYDEIL